MENIITLVFKYLFIFIIYAFMISIIRLIYLDIEGINKNSKAQTYLKLINMKEDLPFKLSEHYALNNETKLGRGSENTITIKDPFISKEHIKIYSEDGDYYLEDLNSANGTFLNEKKVEGREKLYNGDIINIGQLGFIFVNRK